MPSSDALITAYITHQDCLQHQMGEKHPEQPSRLRAVYSYLEETQLMRQLKQIEALPAQREHLLLVHPPQHLDAIYSAQPREGVLIIGDQVALSPGSTRAAELAAGAVIGAVDGTMHGQFNRAFCAVRPPGHHAEANLAMGFCLFNSVAIGVRYLMKQYGIKSVAVLDFDAHHGNGTVDIFKDDPAVLVCSSFEHPFYPGRMYDIERGNIINTPLAAGTNSLEFRKAVERDWIPALERHRPQFIFVSAGFDAHRDDPLAHLCLDEADFSWLASLISSAARDCAARGVISVLEGGYNLAALSRCTHTYLAELGDL